MRKLLWVAVLAGCATSQATQGKRNFVAGPIQKHGGCEGLHLKMTDALGGSVALGSPDQERVTVVVFMNRDNKDEAADFLRDLDKKLLDEPVDSLGVVDVRKYGGVMRSVANWELKRAAERSRAKRKERREQQGRDVSKDELDRFRLVGDFDGKVLEQFGVGAEPKQVVAFVVDRCGAIGSPHHDVESLMAEVNQTVAKSASRSARVSRHPRRAMR
jgi:hypothetical protein